MLKMFGYMFNLTLKRIYVQFDPQNFFCFGSIVVSNVCFISQICFYYQPSEHMDNQTSNAVNVFTPLTIKAYLSYVTNVKDNNKPKKKFQKHVEHIVKYKEHLCTLSV